MIKSTPIKSSIKPIWASINVVDSSITETGLQGYFGSFGKIKQVSLVHQDASKPITIYKIQVINTQISAEILNFYSHSIHGVSIKMQSEEPIELSISNSCQEDIETTKFSFKEINVSEWCLHSFRAFLTGFGSIKHFKFIKDPQNSYKFLAIVEFVEALSYISLKNDSRISARNLNIYPNQDSLSSPNTPNKESSGKEGLNKKVVEVIEESEGQNNIILKEDNKEDDKEEEKEEVKTKKVKKRKKKTHSRRKFFTQTLKGLNLLEFEDKEDIQQIKAGALKNIKVNIYHYYSNLRFNPRKIKCLKEEEQEKKKKEEALQKEKLVSSSSMIESQILEEEKDDQ